MAQKHINKKNEHEENKSNDKHFDKIFFSFCFFPFCIAAVLPPYSDPCQWLDYSVIISMCRVIIFAKKKKCQKFIFNHSSVK